MVEVVTLIGRAWQGAERVETRRDVMATLASVGYREFYAASASEHHPDCKFILADYIDYAGETLLQHGDTLYRVVRTYRTGHALELTCERAPAEEATA